MSEFRFCKDCKHMRTDTRSYYDGEQPLREYAVCAMSQEGQNAAFLVDGEHMLLCYVMRQHDDKPAGNYCGPEGLLWEFAVRRLK